MYTLEVYGRNVLLCGTLVCCFEKSPRGVCPKIKNTRRRNRRENRQRNVTFRLWGFHLSCAEPRRRDPGYPSCQSVKTVLPFTHARWSRNARTCLPVSVSHRPCSARSRTRCFEIQLSSSRAATRTNGAQFYDTLTSETRIHALMQLSVTRWWFRTCRRASVYSSGWTPTRAEPRKGGKAAKSHLLDSSLSWMMET